MRRLFLHLIVSTSLVAALAACQQPAAPDATAGDPAVDRLAATPGDAGERVLLWGDTHLHTRDSADAFENGTNNADIDTAYRFARGLPVRHTRTGEVIRIDEPLDFLVVADHAEMLGVLPRMVDGDAAILDTSGGRQLAEVYRDDPDKAFNATMKLGPHDPVNAIVASLHTPEIIRTSWERHIAAAERYNEPGKFTALIGWEWSSTPNGINQHRVVFTSADADVARQFLPLSNYDTMAPEGLWRFLRETRARTGADFVAIPHNSNLSQGQMWTQRNTNGKEFDAAYSNSIGAGELVTLWRDPDFDPALQAFYYVRVLEIPTPRHQLFDAIALGMDPARTGLPLTLQERAWSSPIWYRP